MAQENKQTPIDLYKLAKRLWPHRKKYYVALPVSLIVTYLIMLCVPRYYTCNVCLAPESSGASAGGTLGSIASSFGISLDGMSNDQDAIYVDLYPNLFESNDFIAKLMPITVSTSDGEVKCSYYNYLKSKQKVAPWAKVFYSCVSLFETSKGNANQNGNKINPFYLTKRQTELFNSVKSKIKCNVDKKTYVITISVEDQDPLVAATMAKESCKKLQEFIINYRTNKARIDYNYYKRICSEAKENYERSRRTYGSYSDANMDVVLESYKSKTEDLENEMQLRYNLYSSLNTQMQMARAKLQEATPAFTVLQSASVPIKPAGPKRLVISLVMTFFVFFILSAYLLLKE